MNRCYVMARAYEGPPRVVVAVDDNVRVLGGTVSMLGDLGRTAGPATSSTVSPGGSPEPPSAVGSWFGHR